MNIKQLFDTPALAEDPNLQALSAHSIVEARDKKNRIIEFYEDPYEDQSERWLLAYHTYTYIESYKKEGNKRKNKFQENILHEQNITLFFKALLKSGALPKKITYQILNGVREALPLSQQSIELLFCVINIHDADEDFFDSSPEEMQDYLTLMITRDRNLSISEMKYYLDMIDELPKMMRAITFTRKTRDKNKNPIKVETHEGDPQLYVDAMEQFWATILTKAGDRKRGVVDRYGPVPNIFSLQRQSDYLDETQDLFYFRQTLENMQMRYPQLHEAFSIINARLNVAYRATRAIIRFHPDNTESKRKTSNPLSARLDIRPFLRTATKIEPYLDDDANDLKDLLINLEHVSLRRPTLRGITGQLRMQLTEFMPELSDTPPLHGAVVMPDKVVYAPQFL